MTHQDYAAKRDEILNRVWAQGKVNEIAVQEAAKEIDSLIADTLRSIELPEKKAAADVQARAINDTTSKVIYKEGFNAALSETAQAIEKKIKEVSDE